MVVLLFILYGWIMVDKCIMDFFVNINLFGVVLRYEKYDGYDWLVVEFDCVFKRVDVLCVRVICCFDFVSVLY